MIVLHRLDSSRIVVNDEQVERVDETPDTVITLMNGNHYVVQESIDEIIELIVDFRASVLARSYRPGAADRPRRQSRSGHLTVFPHDSEEVT